jgi:type I restriction enzyme S subunit
VSWTPKATTYLPLRFVSESPKYVIEGRNLLMNLTAQSLADDFLGRVCLSDEKDRFILNQRIARLRSPDAHTDYLFWVFRSGSFRRFVAKLNAGSLIQHISTKQLASFAFPLPSLEEQRVVVEEIESAVGAIDRLAQAADLVPRRSALLRRSILGAAFSGKLVPQRPDDEPASALLERICEQREAATPTRRIRARTVRQ